VEEAAGVVDNPAEEAAGVVDNPAEEAAVVVDKPSGGVVDTEEASGVGDPPGVANVRITGV
jgi:hypothetical protein